MQTLGWAVILGPDDLDESVWMESEARQVNDDDRDQLQQIGGSLMWLSIVTALVVALRAAWFSLSGY